jgi:hypothetical protein
LSPKEFERLGSLLRNHPGAREYYYHFLTVSADLKTTEFSPDKQ